MGKKAFESEVTPWELWETTAARMEVVWAATSTHPS